MIQHCPVPVDRDFRCCGLGELILELQPEVLMLPTRAGVRSAFFRKALLLHQVLLVTQDPLMMRHRKTLSLRDLEFDAVV